MATLQRALPAHHHATEYFAFITMDDAQNSSDHFKSDRVVPIYRPTPDEDMIDQTIADSFPASDPPAWY